MKLHKINLLHHHIKARPLFVRPGVAVEKEKQALKQRRGHLKSWLQY